MRLYPGDRKTYYQEILRCVGAFLEEKNLQDIRVLETEDGLVVQGQLLQDTGVAVETYLLTPEDLQAMITAAFQKRGRAIKQL